MNAARCSYIVTYCSALPAGGRKLKLHSDLYTFYNTEVGGASSTNGENERCIRKFLQDTKKKRDHLGDLDIDYRVIIKWIKEF
jgi:hypothetical protein